MRGVKPLEAQYRGRNLITVATIHPHSVVYSPPPATTLHKALLYHAVNMQRTLLWTYAKQPNGPTIITFGYDEHIDGGKIGHAALTVNATFAGEIKPAREHGQVVFVISNESGAWGAMGNESGKTKMLKSVAATMASLGINVCAERAYSRHLWKRKLQERFRSHF